MTNQKEGIRYILGSRILTHVVGWVLYYLVFSWLWAKPGQYHQSFGLELILMPLRIGASYSVIYWLMPKYLLQGHLKKFGLFYCLVLIVAGTLQRVLTYYFHELLFQQTQTTLWAIAHIVRSIVLVNTTVLFLSALKMYDYWRHEHDARRQEKATAAEEALVIRSDKRNFRVWPSEILYIEGLGNYVTFYLEDKKPIISYQKLKTLEETLPEQFFRVHKSFIINKDKIQSYNLENIDINNRMIPVSKSVDMASLGLKANL